MTQDEAVAAERERCAKIAEGVVPPEEFQGESMARMLARGIYGSACKAVAEKIRSGQ